MLATAMLIPVGDALAKEIARVSAVEPALVAFARFVLGAAIFLPLMLWRRQFPPLTARFFGSQLIRGLFFTGGIFSMVTAVRFAPLADVFGAFFIAPAVATLIAVLLLKEPVSRTDIVALSLGFVGVLMVTRPGAEMNAGLLWAFAAGFCYGSFNAITRWSAGFAPPLAQIASQLIVASLVISPFALPAIHQATEAPLLLIGSALSSAAANFCLVMAYQRERAAVLAPIIYLQLPAAALIGLAAFGDVPDALALAGLALIVFAGLGVRLIAAGRGREH